MKFATGRRHELILQALAAARFVSVTELAKRFDVSEMTIRRDLERLDTNGKLERTHGGATVLKTNGQSKVDILEPSLDVRTYAFETNKISVARAASNLVSPGQTIALDIGSTTGRLVHELREMRISIYTTSVRLAAQLCDSRAMVYMPGGLVAGSEPSIIGARAVDHLNQLNFDIAFMGASGLSNNGLFYDYSVEDTEIKRALIQNSHRVVMLLDSSKFNRISVARICDGTQVDILITNQKPQDDILKNLEKCGTKILIAE